MKALLCKAFGPASSLVLEDLPSPEPKKNEVLIEVHAAGVNFPDTLIIEGKYQFKPPFPFAPGGEAAGVVKAVGEKIKAKQEADAALALKIGSLEKLMSQLLEPIAEQDQQMEVAMVRLVSHMVREVIQRELNNDSSQIRQVLREALKLLPMGADNVRIHVNPQDFDTIKALRERHEESWRILEDDSLLPGGCRIESEHSQIDASVETRMAQALKQLFEQQRENATHPPAADLNVDLDVSDAP